MSMDPDGTNRIIKQQIKQWHAEVDERRNAKLVEREPRRSLASLLSPLQLALVSAWAKLASFRSRPAATTTAVAVTAPDPKDLVKGTIAS